MPWKASISAGRAMGSLTLCGQPAQVLERVRHALQKVRLALVESAETVGAQRLHDADVNVGVVVLHECVAVDVDEVAEAVEIVVEQLLAQLRRQVGLAVVEQRGDVVLQGAFAAALVVEEDTARPSRSMTLRDWKSR